MLKKGTLVALLFIISNSLYGAAGKEKEEAKEVPASTQLTNFLLACLADPEDIAHYGPSGKKRYDDSLIGFLKEHAAGNQAIIIQTWADEQYKLNKISIAKLSTLVSFADGELYGESCAHKNKNPLIKSYFTFMAKTMIDEEIDGQTIIRNNYHQTLLHMLPELANKIAQEKQTEEYAYDEDEATEGVEALFFMFKCVLGGR